MCTCFRKEEAGFYTMGLHVEKKICPSPKDI